MRNCVYQHNYQDRGNNVVDRLITTYYYIGNYNGIDLSNTKLKSLDEFAFSNCENLYSICFPDCLESIGYRAFSGCKNLEKVELPNGLKKISEGSFSDCRYMKQIDIPESVEIIEKGSFGGWSSDLVITVHYKGFFQPKGWEKGWNGMAKVKKEKYKPKEEDIIFISTND